MVSITNTGESWIMYLLSTIDDTIIDNDLTPRRVTWLIRKALSAVFMEIKMDRSVNSMYDRISMGAQYASWQEIKVRVFIVYHSDQASIKLTSESWKDTKERLCDAILHEFRHDYQYSKRKGLLQRGVSFKEIDSIRHKHLEDGLYMSCPDEVDAYALHAAAQINRLYSSIQIKAFLRNIRNECLTNRIIRRYFVIFKENSVIKKRFLKKLYKSLNISDDK